jgi:hypothetical protein
MMSDDDLQQRRGGVLFEVMLAVALFAGAAAFTLAAVRSVHHTIERSQKQQEAIDLARSKLAQLEARLITVGDLRGEAESVGATLDPSDLDEQTAPSLWRMEVATNRSEFTNLTLVELTVIENIAPEAETGGAVPMRYTLRQLVALREEGETAWEEDDLMRDVKGGAP